MKFQNKLDQHNITVQEKAELENLRKSMLSMGVIILEHNDIYHYSIADHEPDLKIFKYKEENNETTVSLHQQLGMTFYKQFKFYFNFLYFAYRDTEATD